MNYRLSQIAQICGGKLMGTDCTVSEIITDSRLYTGGEGQLFVAIKGANHDSHHFANEMAQRGAAALLVEREVDATVPQVVVDNSIAALQRLAAHHRGQYNGKVVAITGSNGKTIIKEWLYEALPSKIKIFRSPRSYNSQLGVALSLLMIEPDDSIAIIEAGISRRGEMARLEAMIRPEIAVITSIGDAHQEGFSSIKEKVEEKLILASRAKTTIYHSGYPQLAALIKRGIDAAKGGSEQSATERNADIVAATCCALGYPKTKLPAAPPMAMRLEVREGINNSLIINDSYNSDIHSLTIALDSLRTLAKNRKSTLILSEILQSGMEREQLYARVGEVVRRARVDHLILVGAEICRSAATISPTAECYNTTEELLNKLQRSDYADRAILLKGNRTSRFEKINHALMRKCHTTTLEVNLDAMISNLNHFRSMLRPDTKLVAMVKAWSYGAGDMEIAQTLQHQGISHLAVAFADEGSLLRERGITIPIIVLNADDGSFSQMIDNRLEPEIYSLHSLRNFAAELRAHGEQSYPIHIKLDTGMRRLGFTAGEVAPLIEELHALHGVVKVATIFSHLSCADMGAEGEEYTNNQIALFKEMSMHIQSAMPYPIMRHLANSAAIAYYPAAEFELCRLGIGLYGFGLDEGLTPISTLRSKIVQIKEHTADHKVGYGGMGTLARPSRVATIPIGYADGLNRALGCGGWSMLIGGKAAPTVGRICMDSCMVDITDIEGVNEGDEVIIFSPHKGNTAEDMAAQLGTISYEVLTSIAARVKRIYIKE